MARDLDSRQQGELSAFVERLAEIGGYTTTAEWARESGYPASNLSNLRNGRGGIDGYNLLRLIRVAAVRARLAPEHLAVLAERVEAAADGHVDAAIVGRLDELAGLLAEALKLLRAEARQQETGEPQSPEVASP